MIPSKLQSGLNFKTATVNKVNEIIEYLKTQRIVGDNRTIKIDHFTSGIGLSVVADNVKKNSSTTTTTSLVVPAKVISGDRCQWVCL